MSGKDDKLDPLSDQFDPLLALYSDSEPDLPVPEAPALDNLSKFESTSEGVQIKPVKQKTVVPKLKLPIAPIEVTPSTSQIEEYTERKNVIKFMETVEGPLGKLRDCMERGAKIKVITRSATGIRGELLAYLSAFDKMWNLVLEEVTEVWTRKRKRKSPPLYKSAEMPKWRVYPPPVQVTPIDRKTERCERQVGKMLMRGEHVVLIEILE